MRVLVACEESQRVCIAFRLRGHEAYSADIQKPSGDHPEWHIYGDVLPILNGGAFFTMDGKAHIVDRWDLIIAHPPCTYLSSAGSVCLLDSEHKIRDWERYEKAIEAREFFMHFLYADCDRVCIENPAPIKMLGLPPYSQIIEPYMFGEPWKKRTCLWLRGLDYLEATNLVRPRGCWVYTTGRTTRTKLNGVRGVYSAKERSKTFQGIADAMAEQWTKPRRQYTLFEF